MEKKKLDLGNSFTNMNTTFVSLILNNETEIYMGLIGVGENILNKIALIGFDNDLKILSCSVLNNKLYVLTPKEIFVFKKSKE